MNLNYRGINYQKDLPTIDMAEGEIGGQYRGQAWTQRYPRHIPVPQQPSPQLKYRGVSYCNNPRANAEACFAAPSAEIPARVGPTCDIRPKVCDPIEQIHIANLRRRLEYRMEVAKNQGDRNLVRMLEAESKHLAGRC